MAVFSAAAESMRQKDYLLPQMEGRGAQVTEVRSETLALELEQSIAPG